MQYISVISEEDIANVKQAVNQVLNSLVPELGYYATCASIIQELMRFYDKDSLSNFFKSEGRDFPVLALLAETIFRGGIDFCVNGIIEQVSPLLTSNKSRVLCVGCEAAILDIAVRQFEDVHFYVIPHSPEANLSRIEANYGKNITFCESSINVLEIGGAECVLLAFGYGVSRKSFFAYPVFHRIISDDTRQVFSRLVLAGLCDEEFQYHPFELSMVDINVMTNVFTVPNFHEQ